MQYYSQSHAHTNTDCTCQSTITYNEFQMCYCRPCVWYKKMRDCIQSSHWERQDMREMKRMAVENKRLTSIELEVCILTSSKLSTLYYSILELFSCTTLIWKKHHDDTCSSCHVFDSVNNVKWNEHLEWRLWEMMVT